MIFMQILQAKLKEVQEEVQWHQENRSTSSGTEKHHKNGLRAVDEFSPPQGYTADRKPPQQSAGGGEIYEDENVGTNTGRVIEKKVLTTIHMAKECKDWR